MRRLLVAWQSCLFTIEAADTSQPKLRSATSRRHSHGHSISTLNVAEATVAGGFAAGLYAAGSTRSDSESTATDAGTSDNAFYVPATLAGFPAGVQTIVNNLIKVRNTGAAAATLRITKEPTSSKSSVYVEGYKDDSSEIDLFDRDMMTSTFWKDIMEGIGTRSLVV